MSVCSQDWFQEGAIQSVFLARLLGNQCWNRGSTQVFFANSRVALSILDSKHFNVGQSPHFFLAHAPSEDIFKRLALLLFQFVREELRHQ